MGKGRRRWREGEGGEGKGEGGEGKGEGGGRRGREGEGREGEGGGKGEGGGGKGEGGGGKGEGSRREGEGGGGKGEGGEGRGGRVCLLLLFVYGYWHHLVCINVHFQITPVLIDLQFLSVPIIQKKPAILRNSRIGSIGDQNL